MRVIVQFWCRHIDLNRNSDALSLPLPCPVADLLDQQGPMRPPGVGLTDQREGRKPYDCTSRFELAIAIKIPTAKPSVTMAVPP